MSTDKSEATRLADALERDPDGTALQPVIDKLRRWPDGEPVAWVDDLSRPQPHCVTDLKYCSVAQVERGDHLRYIALYTAPPAERIAALEAALEMAVRQNGHDMLLTGEELRQCECALRKIGEVRCG